MSTADQISELTLNFSDEYVFHTVQGEGKFMGRPCVFCRLSGCNLRCAWTNSDSTITTCDTTHASFYATKCLKTIGETVDEITKYNCDYVVITGGEPYLQKNLKHLVDRLKAKGLSVGVETNGTLFFETAMDFISISPKLRASCSSEEFGAMQEKKRIDIDSFASYVINHECQFKFVYNSEEDIKEILDIRDKVQEKVNSIGRSDIDINSLICLMPQGVTSEALTSRSFGAIDNCKKYGWQYSDRLHIRVWGQKKGV